MTSISNKNLKHFALQLQAACDENGIEIEATKSAKIIHQLGMVHLQESPDKISLIKSVGLLNSAIARKPDNVSEIENDLSEVCRQILKCASAHNQTADLVKQANCVKHQVENMRDQAIRALKVKNNIEKFEKVSNSSASYQQKLKIKLMKKIQLLITLQYIQIMKNLCQYCVDIMGQPPCKFAVVGMGSLARKEVTPYSDFEHIILLEIQAHYEKHLEYFRWFSVIFHTIILNLRETIIPSLNIMHLNNKASDLGDWFFDTHISGISFDGMMPHACKFPLGRTQPTSSKPWTTELIKPVDKMLNYLRFEINLKNGYHLSSILTDTCIVYGDQNLYAEFVKGISLHRVSQKREEMLEETKKQVQADLDVFATRFRLANLKRNKMLNVKQVFYRSSALFILALGKLCHTSSSSCFDIINELAAQKKISRFVEQKLLYAMAIACEIRLSMYLKKKSQYDFILLHSDTDAIFHEILQIVEKESIIDFFHITYCLQQEIINLLNIKNTYVYTNSTHLNITICYVLNMDKLMLSLLKNYWNFTNVNFSVDELERSEHDTLPARPESCHSSTNDYIRLCCFEKCLVNLEEEIKYSAESSSKQSTKPGIKTVYDNLWLIARNLLQKNNYDEAVEFWKRISEILQRALRNEEVCQQSIEEDELSIDLLIDYVYLLIIECLVELNKTAEARAQAAKLYERLETFSFDPKDTPIIFYQAGSSLYKLGLYQQSLNLLQTALGIALSEGIDNYNDHAIMIVYSGIGSCFLKLDLYEESLFYLKAAAKQIEAHGIEDDYDVFITLAFSCTTTYNYLGKCLMKLNRLEDALPCFYQALEVAIYSNVNQEYAEDLISHLSNESSSSLVKKRFKELASALYDIGLWYMKLYRFPKAVTYLQRSFNINKKLTKVEASAARTELLTCYMKIYQHAVDIKTQISL